MAKSSATGISTDNPWPGLASFTEEARAFFFGRERETEELVRLIRRNTLTVLFGQSGLGKSSLLQAGAFPVLREADFLPLYLRLDHSVAGLPIGDCQLPISRTSPASEPIGNCQSAIGNSSLADQVKAALVEAFKSVGADAPAPRADETLWEYFHRKDIDIWSAKNRLLTPVLAFDQFEEIFTLGRASEAARERGRAFLAELADLVENRAPAALREKFDTGELDIARYNFDKPSCQVVLSLREDFLPDLEGLKHEMRSIMLSRMRVKRLNGTQALEVVQKPAPHLLAEGVAERIVEFVAGARGGSAERLAELDVEPPLLSVICRELNERRRTLGQAQITADLVSGNRREILTDFYERSVADLPTEMRAFVEDHLLTKSGFRDNLALETALEFPGVTRLLIDMLVSRRLVRIEDRLGVQRVELTHDVLAEVIRASRDTRQQRIAEAQLVQRERLTRRRMWLARGIAAVLLVAFAGASWLAWRAVQSRRAEAQLSSRTDLALASRLLDEGKIGEGLAYVVRAARKDPDNTLLGPRLLSTLASHNFLLPDGPPIPLPSPVAYARTSADGRRIFVQGEDQVLRVISTVDGKLEREFKFPSPVRSYGWNIADKNDRVLAVELENGTLLVCDATTGEPTAPPMQRPNGVRPFWSFDLVLSLSPDGAWLATGDKRSMWIWDTRTGKLMATIPYTRHNFPGDYAFSPDSRSVLATVLGGIRIYSVPDGSLLTEIKSTIDLGGSDRSGLFSPDGNWLLLAGRRGAQVFRLPAGTPEGAAFIHGVLGQHGIFSPDGKNYVLTGVDGVTRIVDTLTGKLRLELERHGGPAYKPQFSRDGKTLLTNSADGAARVWDFESGRLLAAPTLQQEQYMPTELLPDGRSIVMCLTRGPIQRFRLGGGAAAPLVFPRPSTNQVPEQYFLPQPPTRLLAIERTRARVIDAASGREIGNDGFLLPQPLTGAMTNSLRGASEFDRLHENQRFVARTGPGEWRIWTWQGRNFKSTTPLAQTPSGTTVNFVFTQDGTRLMHRTSVAADAALPIWDAVTGQIATEVRIGRAIQSSNSTNGFSPDGKRLMVRVDEDSVWIWDIQGARNLFEIRLRGRSTRLQSCEFSPDGTRIVGTDNWGGGYLWDSADGRLLRAFPAHRDLAAIEHFSPDGRYFSTTSIAGTAKVWRLASGVAVGTAMEHRAPTRSATFGSEGARIATSAYDGTARVWDVATGQPLTAPLVHGALGTEVRGASFSPDGRFLKTHVLGGAGGTWVWAVPAARGRVPGWLLQLATMCAGREVTDAGEFRSADDTLARIDELRRTLAAEPGSSPYAEWGRWLLSTDVARPIAPGFTITAAELKQRVDDATRLPEMTTRDNALKAAGNFDAAEPLEREMLAWVLAREGEDSTLTADHQLKLAQTLIVLGKFAEAESLARLSLAIRERHNTADSYGVASARGTIGSALVGLKRFAEAEPLLLEACDAMLKIQAGAGLGAGASAGFSDRVDSLVQLYEATGRPEKAAEWKTRKPREAAAPEPAR